MEAVYPRSRDQLSTLTIQTPLPVSSQPIRTGRNRRLNLWTFQLPGLKDRREDIEPNIDYELNRYAEENGTRVTFNKEARQKFLSFATASDSLWSANFRDLSASITRMATFAPGGRITEAVVGEETGRLRHTWQPAGPSNAESELAGLIGPDALADIDPFDRVQLAEVVRVCRRSTSLSAAGRSLFAASRTRKSSANDADRLRKYLSRFSLSWPQVST